MKRILLSILSAAALSVPVLAQGPTVPALVNYQAHLTDNANVPYGNTTPTNFDVKFKIYTAATGGTAVWAEMQTVTISAGQLSVLLGNGVAADGIPRPNLDTIFGPNAPVAANGASLFLGITVNTVGSNTAIEFVPRQQIISNPLALRAKFADTAQSVAAGGITSAAFASGSVNAASIADGTIAAADLADGSVTSAKIANDTIVAGDIATGGVTAAEILDGTVASLDLADNAVSSAKIAADAVTSAKIAADTITGADIAADTITAADIAANAVTSSELADNAVGTGELAAAAVTSAKIAANTILADNIASDAVTSDETDFTHEDNDGIHIHTPGKVPGTGNHPSFEVQDHGPGAVYLHGYPNGNLLSGAMFFDSGNFFCIRRHITDSGYARLNNSGGWGTSSDERLKKDITPAGGLLAKALRIQPVHYHWKTDTVADPQQFGVIAQNVEQVIPELVEKGETWTVNYSGLGVVAIGAIQEQQVMVKGQGDRLTALEKENADLKARLERLEQARGTIK